MKKQTKQPEQSQVKKLGVLDGWALGVGAMIGASVFVVSGTMSGMAGPAAALAFLLAAAVTMIIAFCVCEVSSAFPRSGGSYIYPKEVIQGPLGEFLSFLSGMAFYGGQGLGSAALALTLAYYVNWSLQLLGIAQPLPDNVFAILVILFFGIANMVDTRLGNFLQLISTFLVIGTLIIFLLVGGINMEASRFTPFMPFGFSAVVTAAATGWAAFGGWSAIPNMASEFKNPARDVPRSMILSLITCGISFAFIALVMNGLMDYQKLGASTAPMADAFSSVSSYGALVIALGGVFAAISTLNGLMMSGSRIMYSMGVEGSLPRALARRNKKNGTPYAAVIVTMIGMIILAWTGLVTVILQMVVFVTVFSWIVTCVCMIVMRTRRRDITATFRAPLFPITPILAIGLAIFMLMRLSTEAKLIGIGWLLISTAAYFLFSRTPLKKYCYPAPADQPEAEPALADAAQELATPLENAKEV